MYFASGLDSRPECHWCSLSSTCFSPSKQPNDYCIDRHNTNNSHAIIAWEYNCPLGPIPYPDQPPTLLPHWMGEFYQAELLEDIRLVDLSLPGTHDSLSYDLSLTVSTDGIDNFKRLAQLLHTLSGGMLHVLPGELEEFFRMQGKTQQLTIPQQLDNGIRFLDFRLMWEPDKSHWYSIHFMQSNRPAEQYLQQIRTWLDQHPQEIVVIWLSKHGSTTATGQDQYPGVSPAQKQQFWNKYLDAFDGLLIDTHNSSIFATPMAELIRRNHRVISFVSDYEEFTQSSRLAYDAAYIQNEFVEGDGVFREENLLQSHIDYFKNATANNAHINSQGGFTLLAMNTASPTWQIIAAAKRQFLHWLKDYGDMNNVNHHRPKHIRSAESETTTSGEPLSTTSYSLDDFEDNAIDPMAKRLNNVSPLWRLTSSVKRQVLVWLGGTLRDSELEVAEMEADLFHSCSSHIKIPGVNRWCPLNLLDISQLASYYNQIAIEEAYQHSQNDDGNKTQILAAFPNAFYLDALDYDGTIRVGPQLLDGADRGDMKNKKVLPMKDAKYALVDTLLAYNAELACRRRTTDSAGCEELLDRIYKRRSRHRLKRWNEPNLGRHIDWPPYKYDAPSRPKYPGLGKESLIWRQ